MATGEVGAGTLAGRVALVTGGAGSIGAAIGQRLAHAGARVALSDLRASELEERVRVSETTSASCLRGFAADVTDRASVAALMGSIEASLGRLDVVVNCAGLSRRGSIGDLTQEDWDRVLAVNLTGAFNVCQAAAPLLQRGGCGRIVNVGSRVWVAGILANYTAAKAGLVGLTRALARELGPLGITVNVVAPSYVETPLTHDGRSDAEVAAISARYIAMTPLGRVATPQDVAGAVHFLASDDAAFVTGEVIHVCGGSQLAAV